MHYLTRQRLHLSRFHPLMKVLLTFYILSVCAALWVAALKYTDRAVWSSAGVASYVHGDGGAPDDPFGDPFATAGEGMTTRQIIDIVHPHLFTVPIVIFILGHLVHLTRLPDAWKLGVNVTAFTSFLATFLLPFAVVSHAGLAPLLFVSGCVFLASLVALCVIPLWEMWLGRPGDGFDALPKRGS